MSVTLGVMPDYADESKAGMKLSDVREGGPAAKAGVKGGDIIVGIGGKPIGTIYDYMESLGRYKPGDAVNVLVKRDGKELTLRVELGKAAAAPRQ
jgi:S1-C subfamily serine protease